jgi:hypothetical protein
MAHWAELDENNVVIRVTVGDNNDPNGDEGLKWLEDNLGGRWLKTSYNGNIRKNFAAPGYIYDEAGDAFYAPQPYPSWKLDRRSFTWKPPVATPTDGKLYAWDETGLAWVEVA